MFESMGCEEKDAALLFVEWHLLEQKSQRESDEFPV